MKTKCCAYCRVSTNQDDQIHSFKTQQQFFEDYFSKQEDKELVEIYADEGVSGTKLRKRDGFNKMLYDAGLDIISVSSLTNERRNKYIGVKYVPNPERQPKFNFIYIKDSSRLARNTSITDILKALRLKGVYVYFMDLNRSNQNTSDDVVINILFTLSAQESIDKSNKIKFGMKQSAINGTFFYRNIPYGYDLINDKLIINKEEAKIVRNIFDMRLKGDGCRKISNWLRDNNIKTKKDKPFSFQSVNNILHNKTYCGCVVRNKTRNNGLGDTQTRKPIDKEDYIITKTDRVEQIIDEDTFNKVQTIIKSSVICGKGLRRSVNPMVGLIKCKKCGKHYNVNVSRGKKFYNCSTKKRLGIKHCDNKNVSYDLVNDEINKYLQPNILKEHYINIQDKIRALYDKEIERIKSDKSQELIDLEKDIQDTKNTISAIIDNIITANSDTVRNLYLDKQKTLESRLEELESKYRELNKTEIEKQDRINWIEDNLKEIKEMIDNIPNELSLNEVLKYIAEIIVDDGDIKVYFIIDGYYMLLNS